MPRLRRAGTAEIDLGLRHRRWLEPDQGLIVGLYELFDQIVQYLPLNSSLPSKALTYPRR
jgi:hypothetical protein